MVLSRVWRAGLLAVLVVAGVAAGCGGGDDNGGSASSSGGNEKVTLSLLVDNGDQTVKPATALANAFQAKNPNITIKMRDPPAGRRRRQHRQDPAVHQRHGRRLHLQLGLAVPGAQAGEEPAAGHRRAVRQGPRQVVCPERVGDDQVYGAPFGSAFGGGILYNKEVYEKLGLSVPKTWDEFMANNAKIKAAGIDPGDPDLRRHLDVAAVRARRLPQRRRDEPRTSPRSTPHNQAKYATHAGCARGLPAPRRRSTTAGYLNKNYGSAKLNRGLRTSPQGKGAQYPMLTVVVADICRPPTRTSVNDVGFFALPGDDAANERPHAVVPGRHLHPEDHDRRQARRGEEVPRVRRHARRAATPQTTASHRRGPYAGQGLPAAGRRAGRGQGPAAVRRQAATSARRWSSSRPSRARRSSRSPSRSAPASAPRRTAPSSTTRTSRSRPSSSASRAGRPRQRSRPAARPARAAPDAPDRRETFGMAIGHDDAAAPTPGPASAARSRRRGRKSAVPVLVLPARRS